MEMKPFRVSLIAGAIAMTGFASGAFAAEGYVVNSRGEIARSGTGECVRTSNWTSLDATMQCDPDIITSFMPVQLEEPIDQAQVEAAPAQPPMRRISLDTDTTFGFDSAELTDQGKEKLDEIVDASRRAERMQVQVSGHTDRIGPEEYNEDLSRRRAEAVKDYLVSEGVPEESVSIAALGESNPIVQCEGMSGDALVECLEPNRRSEVEFAAFEPVPSEQQEESGVMREGEPIQNGTRNLPE
jgi:OOP family OmpA-OmpF porin